MSSNNPQLGQILIDLSGMHKMLLRKFRDELSAYSADLMVSLKTAIERLDNSEPNPKSRENSQLELHKKFMEGVDEFFRVVVEPAIGAISSASNADFLEEYLRCWLFTKSYALAFKLTMFKHNRFYHEASKIGFKAPAMADCVITTFRNRVLLRYRDRILRIILEALERERNSERIDREKIRQVFETIRVCGMFELVEVEAQTGGHIGFAEYKTEKMKKAISVSDTPKGFMEKFGLSQIREATSNYYKKKTLNLSESPDEYVKQSLDLIRGEERRADDYLYETAHRALMVQEAETNLIDSRAEEILINKEGGLKSWLTNKNEEAISNMYKLCRRRSDVTFPILEQGMRIYFSKVGNEIVQKYLASTKKDPVQYIEDILKLKIFCNVVVDKIFTREPRFSRMREEVFKEVLKVEPDGKNRSANTEFMAAKNLEIYTNNKIKKCYTTGGEEEIFNNIILIFESLYARDSYLLELLRGMSKRLLECYSSKAPKIEVDRKLVDKLKLIEGTTDLAPHEQMIRDFENSQDYQKLIEDEFQGKANFTTTLQVLTNGDWQKDEPLDITFPRVLDAARRHSENVYTKKNRGKVLYWMLNRGVSRLEGRLTKAVYKFTLGNVMAMILLHLDEAPQKRMIYGDLKLRFRPRRLRSKEEQEDPSTYRELNLNLLTLVEQKLIKRTKELEPKFEHEEMIEINRDYVPTPAKGEDPAEGKISSNVTIQPNLRLLKEDPQSTRQQILGERKNRIKASIVTIMKQVKVSAFDKLKVDLDKFPRMQNVEYTMPMLKETLDKLITDGILERDPRDRNTFIYKPE